MPALRDEGCQSLAVGRVNLALAIEIDRIQNACGEVPVTTVELV